MRGTTGAQIRLTVLPQIDEAIVDVVINQVRLRCFVIAHLSLDQQRQGTVSSTPEAVRSLCTFLPTSQQTSRQVEVLHVLPILSS